MSKSAENDMGEVVPEGTMLLPVALDANEVAKLAVESAKASIAYKALDDERKETAAGYAARLKALDMRVQDLSEQIERQSREEYVRIREVVEGSTVSIYREDTGELVKTREATDLERQPALPVDGVGHVAIDSDGIERQLSEKQAKKFADARAKGKAFSIKVDGATVRLAGFKGEQALPPAFEPVPPPPASPRGLILAVLDGGGHAPITEEQEAYVQAGLARKEKPAIDVLGWIFPVSGLRYPRMQEVDAAGIGDQGVDVDGEFHDLSPWWAEMARADISKVGRALVRDRNGQTVRIAAMRPCEACGAADGHHRAEGHADRTPVEPVAETVDNFDLATDPEAAPDSLDIIEPTDEVMEALAKDVGQQELVPTKPKRGRKPKGTASAEVQ